MTNRDSRDRRYWERHAENYDRSMKVLGRPIPRMVELAGESVRGMHRVLEVAAGTGLVTGALASHAESVVATDYAEKMVQELKGRASGAGLTNVRVEQADLDALPYEAQSFDAVVAANVLHLVPDLGKALQSLVRVLTPNGIVVLPTFCHDENASSWLLSRALALTGFPGHRRFSMKSLQQTLRQEGLSIERAELIPGLIPVGFVVAKPGASASAR